MTVAHIRISPSTNAVIFPFLGGGYVCDWIEIGTVRDIKTRVLNRMNTLQSFLCQYFTTSTHCRADFWWIWTEPWISWFVISVLKTSTACMSSLRKAALWFWTLARSVCVGVCLCMYSVCVWRVRMWHKWRIHIWRDAFICDTTGWEIQTASPRRSRSVFHEITRNYTRR